MANNEWWVDYDEKPSLYMWIFTKMAVGACIAGLFLFVCFLFVLFFRALSVWLPEDPNAALELGVKTLSAFA